MYVKVDKRSRIINVFGNHIRHSTLRGGLPTCPALASVARFSLLHPPGDWASILHSYLPSSITSFHFIQAFVNSLSFNLLHVSPVSCRLVISLKACPIPSYHFFFSRHLIRPTAKTNIRYYVWSEVF